MFGRNFINGSVKWLGVPDFQMNDGPPWTLNILAPYANWWDRGSSTSPNWGSGSGGNSEGVSMPWNWPACVLPNYHQMIFENTRSVACCARDDLLMEKCTYRMQNPSTIQGAFNTLVGLFDRVGLQTNVGKTVSIVCCPCQEAGNLSEAVYGRWITGEGPTYRE